MLSKKHGFGLIELLISIVISSVVMLGVYRYWIKGVQTMSDTVKVSAIKARAQKTFNSLVNDLKFLGYNPRAKKDPNNLDGSSQPMPFGAALPAVSPPPVPSPKHLRPYNQLTFSFYSEEADPDYTTSAATPVPRCSDEYCTRNDFYIDSSGTLIKRFWRADPSGTFDQGARDTMILLNNACVSFVFWDNNNDVACQCQDGRKCWDLSGTGACDDDPGDVYPTMIKLVLSVATDPKYTSQFVTDGFCNDGKPFNSPCGCEDNDPATLCCDIPLVSGQPKLDKDKYIKFEKKIFLSNLH